VRTAQLALTLLHGAARLAEDAPGVTDPFDVLRAVEHLAGVELGADGHPPHLALVEPAPQVTNPWSAPQGLRDEISGGPVDLDEDGVIAVLGVRRLAAAEEAVRAAKRRDEVTVVVVTDDPYETGRLARSRLADLAGCLRRVFPPDGLPRLRVVLDDGAVGAALGLAEIGADVEAAVRIRAGRIVARATGHGAAHAATTASAFPHA
jgi:hypothetical protein